jgi:predicted PurR-regulated permease PerM
MESLANQHNSNQTIESAKQPTTASWIGITIALVSLTAFIYTTNLVASKAGPLILYVISMFALTPFRKNSHFVRRMMLLCSLVFTLWLILDLGILLLPFVLSYFIAYLLDPVVNWLVRKKLPRSITSTLIVSTMVSIVVLISVFVFPTVFQQINDVIRNASQLVTSTSQLMDSSEFYKWLGGFGISPEHAKEIVQKEVVPRIESISQLILNAILALLTSLSTVLAQVINVILIPVLTFYFLNDMPAIKRLVVSVLDNRNDKLLDDLTRINELIRAYISGQIVSATFVAILATILFLIFKIPYAIVLGVLCGLLNPIPYVGILASLVVAIITILISNQENITFQIVAVITIVNVLHFLATYFIDPKITGTKVGVHPVLLIASLFVFGHFFGFLGLIVAVPMTAILVMYFNDWRKKKEPIVLTSQPDNSNTPATA